jgi:hypothetical protein
MLKIPITSCFLETYSLLPKTECQSGEDPEGSKVSFLASLKKLLVGTTAAASVWQVSGCMSVCMYGRCMADIWQTDS